MPTQPLTLPNGKVVQIPAEWGPEEAQAWVNKQAPQIKAQWQQDLEKVVDDIPDMYGLGKLVKGAVKGTVDTVAHPIENLPTVGSMLGTGAAAALEGASGGLATPLAIGLPAAGAALGHGVRDFIRHSENDPRASQSLGEEALNAAGTGALEGAFAAVPVGLNKLASPMKNFARNQYLKAINPSIQQLKSMAGSSWKGIGAAADDIAKAGIENKVATTPMGLAKVQELIEGIENQKTPILAASRAKFTPATQLTSPKTNPDLKKIVDLFGDTLDPVESNETIQKVLEGIQKSPKLVDAAGNPKVISAQELHKLISQTERTAKYTYGALNDVKNEANKAMAGGGRKLLAAKVPGLADLNGQERLLINLRTALQNTLSRGEIAAGGLPSIYLAYSHPGIAMASGAIKDPVTTTWLRGQGAMGLDSLADSLAGVNVPKTNLIRQALESGLFGKNSDENQQQIWDLLTKKWEDQQ